MAIGYHFIKVYGVKVKVVQKEIRNLYLTIFPPNGRKIQIDVPMHTSDYSVRLAVISKIKWIKRKQDELRNRPQPQKYQLISGEYHYFMGRRYRLNIVHRYGRHEITLKNKEMVLYVHPGTTFENKKTALQDWYRKHLKKDIPKIIAKWEPTLNVNVAYWNVKKMKTRWGSCNIKKRRIWLNLELAKKQSKYLEYVVIHEMVHLLERTHNSRFKNFMDEFFPKWHCYHKDLNHTP